MRKEILILGAIIVIVIIAAILGSNYYRSSVQNERKPTNTATTTAPAGQLIRPDSPTLGPADAKVTLVEFYDPERYNRVATIRDNLLFGRVVYGVANAGTRVQQILQTRLRELDIERVINRVGLDFEVGPGGKLLFPPQRASIAIARCLISRANGLVLDGALSSYGATEARQILDSIRKAMAGRTLIATFSDVQEAKEFDMIMKFEGPSYVPEATKRRKFDATNAPERLEAEVLS